jgi:hypothetical protein
MGIVKGDSVLLTELLFLFMLEVGLNNSNFMMYGPPDNVYSQALMYTDIEFEIQYKHLFIGGATTIEMWKNEITDDLSSSITFTPFTNKFTFSAGIKNDLFELGYRHMCTHPLIVYMDIPDKLNYEGGYDEVYLQMKLSNKDN